MAKKKRKKQVNYNEKQTDLDKEIEKIEVSGVTSKQLRKLPTKRL